MSDVWLTFYDDPSDDTILLYEGGTFDLVQYSFFRYKINIYRKGNLLDTIPVDFDGGVQNAVEYRPDPNTIDENKFKLSLSAGIYTLAYEPMNVQTSPSQTVFRTIEVLADPVITILGSDTISVDSTFDPMDGVSVTGGPGVTLTVQSNGSTINDDDKISISTMDNFQLTYYAHYQDGTQSVSTNRDITVIDTTSPVFQLDDVDVTDIMGHVNINAGDSSFNLMGGVSATDNVDGVITSKITTDPNLDISIAGIFNITYKVSDSANNTTTKTRTVHIRPVITILGSDTISVDSTFDPMDGVSVTGGPGVTLTVQSNGSTINDDDKISISTMDNFQLTYYAHYQDGTQSVSTNRDITVIDDTGPLIIFDPDPYILEVFVPQQYIPGSVIQNKLYIENKLRAGVTCHDYVDKIVPIFQIDMGPMFDMHIDGDHTVTYTAKDSTGNVTKRTRTLRVTYSGGDPYVYPLIGSCYKLPNCEDIYRLYQDDAVVINAMVSVATPQIQDEIIRATSRTGDFLHPVTTGAYFYSKILVASRTTDDHVLIDLGEKQHTSSNPHSMFKVDLPMVSTDSRPYEDQNASYVSIPIRWGQDMCLSISFSRNVQIRNGVQLSGTDLENGTGLLIRNYRPKFFRLPDIHNRANVEIPRGCRRPLTKRTTIGHREIHMTNVKVGI